MMESRLAMRKNGNIAEISDERARPQISKLYKYEDMTGAGSALHTPVISRVSSNVDSNPQLSNQHTSQYEKEEREMFSRLEKPRVRYDVEVVTKLIVYSGKT